MTANSATALQTVREAMVIRVMPSGRVVSSFVPVGYTTSFGSAPGVPGLGFDYPHLAATSAARHNGSSSTWDRGGHRGQGSYVPILFGGYPYVDYTDYGQSPQQDQAQANVPADTPLLVQDTGNEVSADSSVPAATDAASVPDVGNFILVRQDGRILFASAFTVVGTQLQYITPEGIRRALPMTQLDADATQQMNEARGTEIQLHN